jgi:molybdopterin converting factor small subunit
MKINVEFLGLPDLTRIVGAKRIELDLGNATVREVLNYLITRFGRQVKELLLDQEGKLDLGIQILLNEKDWISHDKMDINLCEGDTITFMMLVAGG